MVLHEIAIPLKNLQGVSKGETIGQVIVCILCLVSPLVVGRVRETYETFPGGSLHTFSPERKYDIPAELLGIATSLCSSQ